MASQFLRFPYHCKYGHAGPIQTTVKAKHTTERHNACTVTMQLFEWRLSFFVFLTAASTDVSCRVSGWTNTDNRQGQTCDRATHRLYCNYLNVVSVSLVFLTATSTDVSCRLSGWTNTAKKNQPSRTSMRQ